MMRDYFPYILIKTRRGDSNEYSQHTHRGDSNEYPKHDILWRTIEIILKLSSNILLICSSLRVTVKILKIRIPVKFAIITLKFEQYGFNTEHSIRNVQMEWQTVQTRIRLLRGAVWFRSALFAESCLSENLGSLRYLQQNGLF